MFIAYPPKQPWEKLDYELDFSELIGTAAITTIDEAIAVRVDTGENAEGFLSSSPAPAISGDGKRIIFWLENGLTGVQYKLTFRVTTNDGQKLEADVFIKVKEI